MNAISHHRSAIGLACVVPASVILACASAAWADNDEFLVVRRSMQVQHIRLASINDQVIEYLPPDKSWERIPVADCIALLNPAVALKPRTTGLLVIDDGQRLPGEVAGGAAAAPDVVAWNHPWLGRVDVPLKRIDSVLLSPTAAAATHGLYDVVLLANGDRQEGLVTALNSTVTFEVVRGERQQPIQIPLNLVASITIVTPKRASTGKRIWFDDGTVVDVQSIAVGDDGYVRLGGSALAGGTQPTRVGLSQIAAILLDPAGLIPLATLTPSRVEGSPTRYVLPKPQVADPDAPLGLSDIEVSGPLVVRYALPAGCQRFVTEAELPRAARPWGDYELVVRSNDAEVFRRRLNAASPTATIDVALTGRELTVEITQGGNGPIQDQVVLRRPMLLTAPAR